MHVVQVLDDVLSRPAYGQLLMGQDLASLSTSLINAIQNALSAPVATGGAASGLTKRIQRLESLLAASAATLAPHDIKDLLDFFTGRPGAEQASQQGLRPCYDGHTSEFRKHTMYLFALSFLYSSMSVAPMWHCSPR